MEKKSRRAGACEGGGDLPANQSRFAHARDHYLASAFAQQFHRANETLVEAIDHRKNTFGFGAQYGGCALDNAVVHDRLLSLIRRSSCFTTRSNFSKLSKARELGPSLRARSGFS